MKIKVVKPVTGYSSDGFTAETVWLRGEFRRNNSGYFRERRRMLSRAWKMCGWGYGWMAERVMQPLSHHDVWLYFDPSVQ